MIGPALDPARDLRGDADFRRVASTARPLVVASHPRGLLAAAERRAHLSALLLSTGPLAIATATLPFLGDDALTAAAQLAVQTAHEAAVAAVNSAL